MQNNAEGIVDNNNLKMPYSRANKNTKYSSLILNRTLIPGEPLEHLSELLE
jgi:hypothetical protein